MKNKVKSRPLTESEFLSKLNMAYGGDYKLIGKYINMNVKTTFEKKSGEVIECTPRELFLKY